MFKYLKYDFKENKKILLSLLAIGALISYIIQANMNSVDNSVLNSTVVAISFVIAMVLIVSFATISIRIFWNELHTNKGYLTFQTPRNMWKMVASKIVLVFIWSFIYLIAAIVINYAIARFLDYNYFNYFYENVYMNISAKNMLNAIIEVLLEALRIATVISIVYLSISLSRVMVKNKLRNYLWIIILIVLIYCLGMLEFNIFNSDGVLILNGVIGLTGIIDKWRILSYVLIIAVSVFLSGLLLDKKVDI